MAKQALDINNLDEKQKDLFDSFIVGITEKAFIREQFDYRRWQMDCALKQEFLDDELYRGSYRDYGLNDGTVESLTGAELDQLESPNKADEFSGLYMPMMVKAFRTYVTHMSNLSFPSNGDWLDLQRGFSEYFYNTGLEKFLPFVNDAWVDIIKTENQRFNFKDRYKTNMAESISYGNSVLGHFYNNSDHVVEPFVPGVGRCGLYPITDDWRKSNLVQYHDVNYQDLANRPDLDQEVIKAIKPQTAGEASDYSQALGSTRVKEHQENNVPFGRVRVHELFCPSIYIQDGENSFTAKNVYLTCLIKPFIDDNNMERQRVYVLKATENVSPYEHGLLFGSFGTNMPGVFYQQGPLMPFLSHQYTANQMLSGICRTGAMLGDPPKNLMDGASALLDEYEVDMPDFEPGALYKHKVESLFGPGMIAGMNASLDVLQYLDKTFEEGVGYSKGQSGSMHQGRKTATEIKESYSGAQMNIVEAAGNYDEKFLRPSTSTRINTTQLILREQVTMAAESLMGTSEQPLDQDQSLEQVLAQNPLFQRLLNYSGIQGHYDQFYKKVQQERLEDMRILQEVQSMAAQIEQLYNFADSEIDITPDEEAIEMMAMRMFPPAPGAEGEEPKEFEFTDYKMEMAYQTYIQEEEGRRAQARAEAQQLELEIKIKELTFKDTKEVPPPSLKLFYQMLTAPVSDSDVVVTGSMTTVSKELARQNLLMFLESVGNFPSETIQKMDFDGVLMMLARANDVALRDLLKDQAQIMREEEEQKRIAAQQQAAIERAQQGEPGSQPAQY